MDPSLLYADSAVSDTLPGAAQGTGSGKHGIAPIFGGGGTMTDAVNSVWDWLNTPFSQPMSPVGIALIVGAVLVAVILWNMVLYHLRIAAETL